MEKIALEIVKFLAGEAASNALQKLLPTKSLEEKVEQALGNALDNVARGNEIWKDKVAIQQKDVIDALVWMVDSPDASIPSTNLFDKKLLDQFKTELEKDANTWAYLQILLLNHSVKKSNEKNEKEIRRLDDKIKELKRNIDDNIRYLTSVPAWADSSTVIGREKDLEKLWEMLSGKKHVMLSGLGGIGKTKLAQLLFHNYRDRFDEVAWIGYKGSLRQSFQYRIEDYRDRKDPWEAMMNDLHNDGKTKLFIIDNVDDDTDQRPLSDKELRNLTGWENTAILLTSRLKEDLRPYSRYELKALGKDDCIAVFNHYYGSEADPELVEKIVALAHYHTFTMELLAKGAKRENLAAYYMKIKKGFEAVEMQIHSEYDDEKATIEWHLRCLFDIQKRSDADKKVLNGFAVLPVNCECSLEEIGQWFGFENKDLSDLMQDGWLSYDEGKQAFSMHPLVRAIVRFDFVDDAQGHKKAIAPEGTTDKILEYYSEASFDIGDGYKSLQRRIDIAESVISAVAQKETETLASAYHKLGSGYYYLSDYEKALEFYKKASIVKVSVLSKDHPSVADSFNNIGVVYFVRGEYDKALTIYDEAMRISEFTLGANHIETAKTYNNIALVYREKSNYEKALRFFEKALRISEFELGIDHIGTADIYNNIALMYYHMNNKGNALCYYEKAMKVLESNLGKNHPNTARIYNNIAKIYHDLKKFDIALDYYEKSIRINESKLGKDHPSIAENYNNIAGVFEDMGNYISAMEYYKKAQEIREFKLGKSHPYLATTYNNIAGVYKAKGDYAKALEYYLKALKIWLNRDVNHPKTKTIFGNLFDCFQEANMEKNFGEWLQEQLSEKEWAALLDFISSPTSETAS